MFICRGVAEGRIDECDKVTPHDMCCKVCEQKVYCDYCCSYACLKAKCADEEGSGK